MDESILDSALATSTTFAKHVATETSGKVFLVIAVTMALAVAYIFVKWGVKKGVSGAKGKVS